MSNLQRLFFLTIVSAISCGMHAYLASRFLAPARLGPGARQLVWAVALAHGLALPWLFQLMSRTGETWADLLQTGGWVSFGLVSMLFFLTLGKDIAWWVGTGLADLVGGPADPERRQALARLLNAGVGLTAVGLSAVGYVLARRTAEVKRVRVPIAGLPEDLRGFKIAQISDLHVGPTIRDAEMRAVTERVNALSPDLIAVTGDLVDGPVETLADMVAPLGALIAPHGVFFITGNHEYYSGAREWCDHCADALGWRVLLNDHQLLEHGGARLVIAGVTDRSAGRMDPDHAMDLRGTAARSPQADLSVLLAHQPADAEEAAALGYHLQLSGHTHGGQFFPFTVLIRLAQRFVVGLHKVGGMWLYVNPGTTYWGPPNRAGMAQEITLIELVAEA